MALKTIELRPIRETNAEWDPIEKKIQELLRAKLYVPLMKLLKLPKSELHRKVKNAPDSELVDALKTGRITFYRGKFSGRFTSAVSKELRGLGAQWERKTGTWNLPQSSLPPEVVNAIAASESRLLATFRAIDDRLTQILPEEIADQLHVSKFFDKTLWKVESEFQKTVKNLTVAPDLTSAQAERIASEWQTNLRLYIKDFTAEQIVKLRTDLKESVLAGNRHDSAVKAIQASYGVSLNKAKFLARQETALMMAKYKQTRYEDAGVEHYKWACVKMPHDTSPGQHTKGNVRYSHGLLEGKTFRWNDPPITTAPGEPMRRNNPGQDYNCRCFAIPVVKVRDER